MENFSKAGDYIDPAEMEAATLPPAAQDPRLRPTQAATEAAAEIVPEAAPEEAVSLRPKKIVSIDYI